MNAHKDLQRKKERRVVRTRARILGTPTRPRLAVFRSNRAISAQLIDDQKGHTIVSMRSVQEKSEKKTEAAFKMGEKIAKLAQEHGVTSAVFDRRSYQYHGRVKAVAEGARKGGLTL